MGFVTNHSRGIREVKQVETFSALGTKDLLALK